VGLLRVALLLLILAPCAATAQLSLAEVLGVIERNNPELAAARLQRPLAAADLRTARAYPNPELEIMAGPWRSRVDSGSGWGNAIGIAQPLELPSVRTARVAAAEAGALAAEEAIRAARAQIGFAGRGAFYEVLRREEAAALAAQAARLLEEIRSRVEARVRAGEAPRLELARAEAESLAAQAAQSTAALRLEEARATLRRIAGNALPAGFELVGLLPMPGTDDPLAVLQTAMIASHPALRAAQAERERALKRLEEERALRYPAPTLRVFQAADPEMRQLMLGVSLPLPLWNRREGPIERARAGVELAQAGTEVQRAQLLRELDSAYARAGVARRQIETYEAGLLRSAQAALDAAQAAYRAGERSFIEVLDAQRTLRTVRADYMNARYDLQAARLELARLAGRDPFLPEWQ